MFRMLALGGAVIAAAILPTASAHADPICRYVVFTGVVTDTVSGCVPYDGSVSCNTTHAGPSNIETVYVTICFPSLGVVPAS